MFYTLKLLFAILITLIFELFFCWAILIPYSYKIKLIKPVSTIWAKTLIIILGLKVQAYGLENVPKKERGFLSISNHQSFIDILLFVTFLKRMFLMKSALLWTPFGWGGYLSGALTINRSDHRSHLQVINKTVKLSQQHSALHVFPEGTRSQTGQIQPFKKGMLVMAYKKKMLILPSGIWGTHLILGKKSLKLNTKQPAAITVGQIINPNLFDNVEDFINHIQKTVTQLALQSKERCQKIS